MKIHIQRRHASMLGEESIRSQLRSPDSQVFSNIGNSLYKTNNDYLKDNYNYSYVHQEDPPGSKNYYHNDPLFFEQQGRSQEHKKDSLSKMGDSMRDMYYAIRTVVEIKNMSKQFQSSYSPPPVYYTILRFFIINTHKEHFVRQLLKHCLEMSC
jgi:hypothetical protein